VKPAPFRYPRASDVADAVRVAATAEGAVFISGGQSLMPMLNLRLARPELLVDINDCGELDGIRLQDDELIVGALTRHHVLATSPIVRSRNPLLAEAGRSIGYYPIRQRGTIGGSLAHADPAAQWPLMAVLFDAVITLTGTEGERVVPAGEFFLSVFTTAREPGELVTSIRFPCLAPSEGWAYSHLSKVAGDFAIASAATTLTLASDGRIATARIALGAVADTPLLIDSAALLGRGGEAFEDFARDAVAGVEIEDGALLSAEDRRDAAAAMITKSLAAALARAGGKP
jgi:carbon-monoxide dehydrogenase medium subunit